MSARGVIVANPIAGSVESAWSTLKEIAERYGLDLRLVTPESPLDVIIAETARDPSMPIIAAGGDGTLHAVVNALGPRIGDLTLGLLPVGTGNDFARSLWDGQVPSLPDAIETLLAGRATAIDLLSCEYGEGQREWCVNAAVAGFGTVVDEKVSDENKATLGPLAFLWGATKALPELKAYTFSIHADSEDISTRAINIVLANGQFVAGGKPIAPHAKLTDGLVDILIFPELPFTELLVAGAQLLAGTHVENPEIRFLRAKEVIISSVEEASFNLDGDIRGKLPAVYRVVPGAIRMLIPSKADAT